MDEPLRVIFDTQIFLRALINPHSICAKIAPDLWLGRFTLYTSEPMIAELQDVLTRPPLRGKFPQITDSLVAQVFQMIRNTAIIIEVDKIEAIARDPKDDIFLACAKTGSAHYLVSEDKDLLVLESHHSTQIVNAFDFLTVLQNLSQNSN